MSMRLQVAQHLPPRTRPRGASGQQRIREASRARDTKWQLKGNPNRGIKGRGRLGRPRMPRRILPSLPPILHFPLDLQNHRARFQRGSHPPILHFPLNLQNHRARVQRGSHPPTSLAANRRGKYEIALHQSQLVTQIVADCRPF